MDETSVLTLQNASAVDRFEFEPLAEPGLIEITEPTVDENEYGEFLTGAVVIWLSAKGIKALATWLNKRRSEEKLTVTATLRKPGGEEQEITINWSRKDSEAATPEQLKTLGELFGIDLDSLKH